MTRCARCSERFSARQYSTPRGYALSDVAELENIAWIGSFQRRPLPELIGVPDALTQRRVELLAAAGARNCALVRRLWADEPQQDEALRVVRASCRLSP